MPAGTTAIRRDMFRGRLWTAYPTRVLDHTADRLALVHWPGVEVLVPTTWIAWLNGAGDDVRQQALPNLARGHWNLDRWTWKTTTWVHLLQPGRWFSLNAVIEDDTGELRHWYINFERPYVETRPYIDTFDLLLDLVVAPDGAIRWKDESDYQQVLNLGIISPDEHRQVKKAREEALAFVRQKFPFDEEWADWRRDPAWPLPVL